MSVQGALVVLLDQLEEEGEDVMAITATVKTGVDTWRTTTLRPAGPTEDSHPGLDGLVLEEKDGEL
jgi:hypothetical protein